jgi:hypothetical protein
MSISAHNKLFARGQQVGQEGWRQREPVCRWHLIWAVTHCVPKKHAASSVIAQQALLCSSSLQDLMNKNSGYQASVQNNTWWPKNKLSNSSWFWCLQHPYSPSCTCAVLAKSTREPATDWLITLRRLIGVYHQNDFDELWSLLGLPKWNWFSSLVFKDVFLPLESLCRTCVLFRQRGLLFSCTIEYRLHNLHSVPQHQEMEHGTDTRQLVS